NGQRLGESAALVELDVDHSESTHQRGQVSNALQALIRSDPNGRIKPIELCFLTNGQRLLDQGDARVDQYGEHRFQQLNGKSLIRIDTEPDIRTRSAHRTHTFSI